MAGVVVQLIKNLLYLLLTGAGDPVGVFSNFVAGISYVVPISIIYHKYKGKKSLVSGLIVGTVLMTVAMSVLNYYLILPVYSAIMEWEMSSSVMLNTVFVGIAPFNLIKGVMMSVLLVTVFIKISYWI